MNPQQFFKEIKKLRVLQKRYFQFRSSTDLKECKRQEKLIDEEIERVEKALIDKQQQKLFK